MTTAAIHTFEARLKGMIGNTYMLNTQCFKFLNYEVSGNQFLIGTDKKILRFDIDQAHQAIERFLPTDPEDKPNAQVVQFQMTSLEGAGEIKRIIMDNIAKIKENREYIPQAAAINDNVKTLLDFAKTEIQMYEMLHKVNYVSKG